MTQKLELQDKSFCNRYYNHPLGGEGKTPLKMSEKIGIFSTKINTIKINQMEISEMKTQILGIINSLNVLCPEWIQQGNEETEDKLAKLQVSKKQKENKN